MTFCTCTIVPSVRSSATIQDPYRKYAIRLDCTEDGSTIDPACPYHGKDGTMVAVVRS